MSAQGSTPGDAPENYPNDASGGHTGAKSSTSLAGPSATSPQPVRTKPMSLRDEIFAILLTKARKAANVLKPLNLPESTLEKAAGTVATRGTNGLIAATFKYARKSANASKLSELDVLNEVLVAQGIAIKKPRRLESAKKDPVQRKQGGGHGNKP